ncbi:hypothetical protein [Massilia sp. CFBP9026]|uniref:hypothetical protein n=1 Tax=Massilia sp. CFBP9026 TaxID=3096536 RepID=UPI002A69AE55|nr:hypothetical protein [Massilia sp. CFBP9026]MDY0964857.1 hypothetical protein [Massilia sp. CFBP9026]
MKTVSLRLLPSLVLMAASLSASAGPTVTRALEVKGVFNEKVGPATQCASTLGGKLAGHGETADGTPVAFVGGDCFAQSGTTFTFSNGKFVLLFPNGDQIFANYGGQFLPTGAGTAYVMNGGTFTITGGSGTYARATGGGYLSGTEDLSTGAGTIALSGRVSYKPK